MECSPPAFVSASRGLFPQQQRRALVSHVPPAPSASEHGGVILRRALPQLSSERCAQGAGRISQLRELSYAAGGGERQPEVHESLDRHIRSARTQTDSL